MKNPTPQKQREERIFIVFPEPSNSLSTITERAPEAKTLKDAKVSTVAPESEKSSEEELEEVDQEGSEEEDVDHEQEEIEEYENSEEEKKTTVSATQVKSRSDDGEEHTKIVSAVTTEAPTTTTPTLTTTTPVVTTTKTVSTSSASTTTPAPSSTARTFRGTPRAPKNKFGTSTAAPVTTTNTPIKNATADSTLESEENTTTHKTPHFEVVKKENAPILKPATRPSARLVEFLKNKKPGSGKRFQLHPSPENTTSDSPTPNTSTAATTTTTSTSTAAPETTTRARRNGAFGSRGKTKMLEKSASEIHAVSIAPPESAMEMRRARFFSSASSMLSGFVPAVPMPRATSQMVTRNSRASCANPAGCISPEKAEVLMTSVQETIKNNTVAKVQTAIVDTASAIRNKIQSRRNNPPRRRTTAAPLTTTDTVTIKSSALRLAQRRRPVGAHSSTLTSRSSATTAMPSLITMKQILDFVVTPAPIMVAHAHDQTAALVQEATTFKPLSQRFKGLERRINPAASLQAQIRPQT